MRTNRILETRKQYLINYNTGCATNGFGHPGWRPWYVHIKNCCYRREKAPTWQLVPWKENWLDEWMVAVEPRNVWSNSLKASSLAHASREDPDPVIDPDAGRLAAGSMEPPELNASTSLDGACQRLEVPCGRMEPRPRLSRDGVHWTDRRIVRQTFLP